MATFSTVVFSFCQRECGFALGTILGMFVILPVRTIFRRFYSGYVAHYEWYGCVFVCTCVCGAGVWWLMCAGKNNVEIIAGTAAQNITPRVLAQHVVEPQQSIAGDDLNGMVKTMFVYGLGFIGVHWHTSGKNCVHFIHIYHHMYFPTIQSPFELTIYFIMFVKYLIYYLHQ